MFIIIFFNVILHFKILDLDFECLSLVDNNWHFTPNLRSEFSILVY